MGAPDLQGLFRRLLDDSTDNFGRLSVGQLTEILDVAGESDFTPERLRYYKDGQRRFLQYGTDSNFTETDAGHLLEPDSGMTLEVNTATRTPYPVGVDLWPSVARRITQAPQSGDVVGGGYGVIDLANFDPDTVTYSGTDADGYFWYHTADTGLDRVLFAGVRNGTVYDSFETDLTKTAGVLTVIEQRLNCYDVGPSVFRETSTDTDNRERPQLNNTLGSVAADDGKGAATFSHRVTMAVHQAAGNSGLGIEAGSMGVKASYDPSYKFKVKRHAQEFTVDNDVEGTYEAVGAIQADPDRPEKVLRINDMEIETTPTASTTDIDVLLIAVDPDSTSANRGDFSTPVEHNPVNSVVEELEDNTITGPDFDGAGTDITGPDLAGTMTNPGGYQLGARSVRTEGQGSKVTTRTSGAVGVRQVQDTDMCLVLADARSTGTFEVSFITSQN